MAEQVRYRLTPEVRVLIDAMAAAQEVDPSDVVASAVRAYCDPAMQETAEEGWQVIRMQLQQIVEHLARLETLLQQVYAQAQQDPPRSRPAWALPPEASETPEASAEPRGWFRRK
jgi:hypothetical protein